MDKICRKLKKKNLEGLKSEALKHPSFLCDSSFELVRVTFLLHFNSGFGLVRADSFSSLMVQVLGMFELDIFAFFGSGFDHIRANLCTLQVHVLSMSEPLLSLCFLKHFLFFFENKTLQWYVQWKWKLEIGNQ